jgi:hypothetical protein
MRGVDGGEQLGPRDLNVRRSAVVDVGRGVQAEAGMAVLVVVVGEEALAVGPRILDRAEPAGELGPVLQPLELRFGERVVVGDVGAGVGLVMAGYRRSGVGHCGVPDLNRALARFACPG